MTSKSSYRVTVNTFCKTLDYVTMSAILSQNYIEILKDDEYYDITIEVGEDPNVKIFRAHMIILCYRSPFLRRTLASNKKNDSRVYAHIKLSNISPETFQIILKYIYGGIISLNEQEPSETLKILSAADKLHLQELVD
ncbi:POZ domain-containing protein [Rhizophagus irregularis]|uniref:POZ domain-containing protein n=1 Tax=Rhizophagus irregularis TaxID=588596 RepID=A0A2N1MDC4_9GLOM|nr:POZ domain-containing protein [Rhizophagus irregularis]